MKAKDTTASSTIALNKRARHDYHIDDRFEAGLALQGWEVKSLREGKAQISESYAIIKGGEMFLFGAQISPLLSASTHVVPEARRTRKLLLHRREIDRLKEAVQREGYTLLPLEVYLRKGRIKVLLGLCKGKKQYDKRQDERKKDASREMERALRR